MKNHDLYAYSIKNTKLNERYRRQQILTAQIKTRPEVCQTSYSQFILHFHVSFSLLSSIFVQSYQHMKKMQTCGYCQSGSQHSDSCYIDEIRTYKPKVTINVKPKILPPHFQAIASFRFLKAYLTPLVVILIHVV